MNSQARLREILVNRKYRPKTVEAYEIWIVELSKFYNSENIDELEFVQIREFFRYLTEKRKVSVSTLRQARSAIQIYYKSVANKDFKLNELIHASGKRPDPEIPTQAEVIKIIKAINNESYKSAVMCIYGMGLTLGEITDIKVEHLDFKRGILKVAPGKKTSREVVIPSALEDTLSEKCKNKRKNCYVFNSNRVEKLDGKAIQRAIAKAKHSENIPKEITPRTLRHAYIKHLEFLGIPLASIIFSMKMSLNGGTLEFYSSLDKKDLKINFSPLDRVILETEEIAANSNDPYISENRISQLTAIKNKNYDLSKLLGMIRELNIAHQHACFISIAAISRSITDHVPPIFNCKNFTEVANNYSGSTSSFKKHMAHIENSMRNIANSHLHTHIRRKELNIEFVQVDFRADLDVLLSEVIRILQ